MLTSDITVRVLSAIRRSNSGYPGLSEHPSCGLAPTAKRFGRLTVTLLLELHCADSELRIAEGERLSTSAKVRTAVRTRSRATPAAEVNSRVRLTTATPIDVFAPTDVVASKVCHKPAYFLTRREFGLFSQGG